VTVGGVQNVVVDKEIVPEEGQLENGDRYVVSKTSGTKSSTYCLELHVLEESAHYSIWIRTKTCEKGVPYQKQLNE